MIPGIIYGWKNGYNIEVFDGIHRYLAAKELNNGNIHLLFQLHINCNEKNIIDEFKAINKSVSIPVIYLEQNNYIKKNVCETVTRLMSEKYPNNLSPSRNCWKQNFNRDNMIDFIDSLNIALAIFNELNGLNNEGKLYIQKHKIEVPQKTLKTNLYLFYLDKYYLKIN